MTIFVAVGTSHFNSLVERMDAIAPRLPGTVVMQIGLGSTEPKNARWFRFAPTLEKEIAGADIVVSHGGFGVMTEALQMGKKLVAVQNSEMFDNHQVELLEKFDGEGYIFWARDLDSLEETILEANRRTPRPYSKPESTIGARIRQFLGSPGSGRPAGGG